MYPNKQLIFLLRPVPALIFIPDPSVKPFNESQSKILFRMEILFIHIGGCKTLRYSIKSYHH